jgi:hypothetical protein
MEAEHCTRGGSKDMFEFKKRQTCPAHEWAITVYGEFPPDDSPLKDSGTSTRITQKIDVLMNLGVVKQADLEMCEVIAVVLYTGPMVSSSLRQNVRGVTISCLLIFE